MSPSQRRAITVTLGIALFCIIPTLTYAKTPSSAGKHALVFILPTLTDTTGITQNNLLVDPNDQLLDTSSSLPTISNNALLSTGTPTSTEKQGTTTQNSTSSPTNSSTTKPSQTVSSTNPLINTKTPTTTPVENSVIPMNPNESDSKLLTPTPEAKTLPINNLVESGMEKFFNGTYINYYASDAFSPETTTLLLSIASVFSLLGLILISGVIEWITNIAVTNKRNILQQKIPESSK